MKKLISLCATIFILISLQAQTYEHTKNYKIFESSPCYTVAENNLGPNILFEFDPISQSWTNIGEIDPIGDDIKAIATDPVNDIIYAYDAGTDVLGIIDPNNETPTLFTPINADNIGYGAGIANGDYGPVELNSIKGLTYDPVNMFLYAVHYINSGDVCKPTPNTNDLLFKIDISTGKFIPGAMIDNSGYQVDYAVIQESIFGPTKLGGGSIDMEMHKKQNKTVLDTCIFNGGIALDVDDIAYNPYTGDIFASQHHDSSIYSPLITIINSSDGSLEEEVFHNEETAETGMGFSSTGVLYVTSGGGNMTGIQNAFTEIDLIYNITSLLPAPDPTGANVNFEAFDCFTAFNDLALRYTVDTLNSLTSTVVFLTTVYNQGNFTNTNIKITNYIPDGLTLNDLDWNVEDSTAIKIITDELAPGDSISIPITFTINSGFEEQTINSYAEISYSFAVDLIDNKGNIFDRRIRDIDSQPDNVNNELLNNNVIIDNVIDQRGPFKQQSEDEDDHDIASITIPAMEVSESLSLSTTIIPSLCFSNSGATEVEILVNGTPPYTHKWLNLSGNIVHLETNNNTVHEITGLQPGTYFAILSDVAGEISAFVVNIPLLASSAGNLNCSNSCPEYLTTPNNLIYGVFQAEESIEINGFVNGSQDAEFRICK